MAIEFSLVIGLKIARFDFKQNESSGRRDDGKVKFRKGFSGACVNILKDAIALRQRL